MSPVRPEPGRRVLGGIALRLALGLPLLIWLAQAWGWHYANLWLPWYRTVLELALPNYAVVSLGLSWQQGEWRIVGEFVTERLTVVHGQLVPAGTAVTASTLMAHSLKHPLILAAAALAWPGLSWRGRGLRLLLCLPLLLLLATLDAPLVLASAVSDLVSWMASPQADAASVLVDWARLLDGGGRVALSLAAALAAAAVQGWLVGARRA